ncbi:MAG: autotransporter outer membrane beta-barrel domain-containing protein, partial [Pseudomonadota bacterium]
TANNTTQTVNSSTLVTDIAISAAGASAVLTVNAATAPVFVKSFSPNSILQGEVSTLTFSMMNGAAIPTGTITISEALTGGAVLANPINLGGTCIGAGTTASAGDASFDITGFALSSGVSCGVTVDVTSVTIGDTDTAVTPLASDIGGATPAVATLTTGAAPVPTVAVDFDLASVVQGGTAILTIDITNGAAISATGIGFADALPAGMFTGTTPAVTNGCGGALSTDTASEALSLSGVTLLAGATCQIALPVVPSQTGTNAYTLNLTSDLGNAAAVSDSINVTAAPVPTLSAAFAPATVAEGGQSTLTITFDNSTALVDATGMTVNLSLLPELELASPTVFVTDCAGLAPVSGSPLSLEGGTIPAAGTCTASLDLRAIGDGSLAQPTGDVITSLGTSASVDAALTVTPAASLGYTIAINPGSVTQGNVATVTVTLDNSANLIAANAAAFSVALGGTMEVAAAPNAATTCAAGTVTATAGSSSADLAGGTITEGTSCTVSFDVTSLDVGSFDATLGTLTTDVADTAGGATATLAVSAAPAPEFTQTYAPSTIGQGETSRLSLQIDNSTSGLVANRASIAPQGPGMAGSLGFSVTLPTGMTIEPNPNTSNTCGGMVTATGNGTTVVLSGGSVGAGSTCIVGVDVTSTTEGTLGPVTGSLSSSLGGSALSAPTTPLAVTDNPFGSVTFVQNSIIDGTFNFASSEPSLTFDIAVAGGSGSYGPVALDAGTYSVTQTRPDGLTNATLVCGDGNTTVDVAAGSVSLVIDDGDNFTCTWGAANSIEDTVEAINSFLQRRNNLILSNGPSVGRRMERLNQGVGRARTLRFQNGDLASATPFTFDFLSVGSGNYKFSTSLQQVERSRRMFMLMVDGVENNVEVYTPPRWDIWFEATFAEFNASQSDGHFAIAHLGADYLVNEDLLLGFALQFDSMDQGDNGGATVEGNGWMAGPYMTARLAENLIFDGRIAYGQSSNTYDPKTTYVDKFDSNRFLIEATLSGSFDWDDWVVSPNFSLAYIEDTAESYVNGLGQTIPEQKVSLGQVRFGPTFSTTFEGRNQTIISPTFSVNAIYNFAETDGVTLVNDTSEETNGVRARIEAGVRISGRSGVQFEAGAHYDGIGQSDYESYGARLRVVVPLN